jgi:two-component system sensor histidine kinase DesK
VNQARVSKRSRASGSGFGWFPDPDARLRMRSGWWLRGHPMPRMRVGAAIIWIGFIAAPIADGVTNADHGLGHWAVLAASVAFSATYMWLVFSWFDTGHNPRSWALAVFQVSLATALTVADRPSWGYLYSYTAGCAALVAPSPYGFPAVLAQTALSIGATSIGGANAGTALGFGASTVGVGLLLTLMRDLRMRNVELTEARAELARTAVAAERERFARDLHDLLGHTLSVITLKTELAGRLLADRPEQAAVEIREVEHVARKALGEVRDAVSGYRQPTLAGEMEGARMALAAAGIIAEFEHSPVSLDPDVEAVLAWGVREGATNVIRHSGASHCQVRVAASLADAEVEVLDDGAGCQGAADGVGGNGLPGLRERAEGMSGRIEAGTRPDGGFRLRVSVPVAAGPAADAVAGVC